MRTIHLVLIILVVFSLGSPAAAQQMEVGVIGGGAWADLRVVDTEQVEMGTRGSLGWSIGAVLEMKLNERFSFWLTPTFGRHTTTLRLANYTSNSTPDMDFRMSVLELPLLLKLAASSHTGPYLVVGPTLAFPLRSALEARLAGVAMEGDAGEITEGMNLELTGGVGLRRAFGTRTVFVELRYSYGLSDLLRAGTVEFEAGAQTLTAEYPDMGDMSTRSFRLRVGATVPLGRR